MIFISIPSDDVILNALNHEIRREILQLLSKTPMTYTQLLEHFTISSGKLNYHLKLLMGFVEKDLDGNYTNSPLGTKLLTLLNNFRNTITENERPLLKKAYVSQTGAGKSYLQLKLVGSIYLKIILFLAIFAFITILTIIYALAGVSLNILLPIYLILIPIGTIAIIWTLKLRKPAQEFAEKVDKLIDSDNEN